MQSGDSSESEQQSIVDDFITAYDSGDHRPCLIHGVTGSGKTEVYMALIDHVLLQGKQAIVLIPEIALTYQTVSRFYSRFGNRICVMHSRLSAGEKCDQFERAAKGETDIMIGARSALFTPFPNLGLIIIDEEHEGAYKSETSPRYHAREVAEKLAQLSGAALVLGSATPSVEAYAKSRGQNLPAVYARKTRKDRK
ncbi:MAG: DEAD/DEAH box helicase [Clostridium sp.]